MRKEPYSIGSYVHVVKRGSRGLPIVRDEHDRRRFLLMLKHFNDQYQPDNWFRDLIEAGLVHSFERPSAWPTQEKIVEILNFCLLDNHFHLLLKEIIDGGISKFMKRLGTGMAKHFNDKYQERGSLFQGAYRSRTVNEDSYLHYVSAYIQIKNCFELHPRGYAVACKNFGESFVWAQSYPYCSLGEFTGARKRAITEPGILSDIFTVEEYKNFCFGFNSGRLTENIVDV